MRFYGIKLNCCYLELDMVTLSLENDLDSIRAFLQAKYNLLRSKKKKKKKKKKTKKKKKNTDTKALPMPLKQPKTVIRD